MNFKQFLSYAFSFSLLLMVACSSNNPVTPPVDNKKQVDPTVQSASQSSSDIYQNISSFNDISSFMQGQDALSEMDVPEVKNPQTAMRYFKKVQQQAIQKLEPEFKRSAGLQSSAGDSLVWDVTERDSIAGVTHRIILTYDKQTGIGTLKAVDFDFRDTHPLELDSTTVVVDLNFTIFNDSDDLLVSLDNVKRYKPGRLIQEEQGTFIPDAYSPGSEPDGGVLTSKITYSNSNFISKTDARFEYHAGQGGSYSKTTSFSDGKKHLESITFNEDDTGSYTETRRDGTQINGTFDSADKDGIGSFSETTTFPEGHNPVSISESGNFTMNLADSTISGTFERNVKLKDGSVQKESVTVDQTLVGDVKTTTLNIENPDGSKGFITITESPEVNQIKGEWTEPDDTFIKFNAENYVDGSAHLMFDVYASVVAFENKEAPIASGEFDFAPDGSGSGTITKDGVTYVVTINPDGSVTIVEQNG